MKRAAKEQLEVERDAALRGQDAGVEIRLAGQEATLTLVLTDSTDRGVLEEFLEVLNGYGHAPRFSAQLAVLLSDAQEVQA